MLIGNPGQPVIQKYGIVQSSPSWWNLRAAYLSDFVYRAKFKNDLPEITANSSYIQLSTDAALITFNIKNIFDFYGIFGSSKLQLDHEIYTTPVFAWGVGAKCILFRKGSFQIGADLKYFETDQKPLYFVGDGLAYNVESDFRLRYSEVQSALGISYRTPLLSPYIQVSYLIANLEPHPYVATVRMPQAEFRNTPVDIDAESVDGQRRWGLAVGMTIISSCKGSLTLESRVLNQNAVNMTGEIRF